METLGRTLRPELAPAVEVLYSCLLPAQHTTGVLKELWYRGENLSYAVSSRSEHAKLQNPDCACDAAGEALPQIVCLTQAELGTDGAA
jgi:hypothetical protein